MSKEAPIIRKMEPGEEDSEKLEHGIRYVPMRVQIVGQDGILPYNPGGDL